MQNRMANQIGPQEVTLVLGGTGKIGHRVAERLSDRGICTRAAARTADPAFDWNDRRGWSAVLDGVAVVFISYAPDLAIPGATDTVRAFVEQAVGQGVKRLVLLSGRGEDEARRCERIVQSAGVDWTVVRASWFNQNFSEGAFLDMIRNGNVALPAGTVAEPFVDADDIADVAVAALAEDGHHGKVYEITGPRCLTFAEAVEAIATAEGREIQYVRIPGEAFRAGVAESGAPDDVAWLLDYLFSTVLDGRNAQTGDGVQRALGREPKDFSEYARQSAASGVWKVPPWRNMAVA